ncbi:hypothetical protein BJ742DRAFT_829806, partial [Cladochytrium replicatum]
MAGLPATPLLSNPFANANPDFHFPAVPPGGVTLAIVGSEELRKHKLVEAEKFKLVTVAEVGQAAIRVAYAVSQAMAACLTPQWYAGASIEQQNNLVEHEHVEFFKRLELVLGPLFARNANSRLHARNTLVAAGHSTVWNHYWPLSKEVSGFADGPPLLEMVPVDGIPPEIARVLDGPAPAPGANVFPPPVFPLLERTSFRLPYSRSRWIL